MLEIKLLKKLDSIKITSQNLQEDKKNWIMMIINIFQSDNKKALNVLKNYKVMKNSPRIQIMDSKLFAIEAKVKIIID